MKTSYKVFLNEEAVGTAEVIKTGLYYSLHCRCDFPTRDIYRITVQNGGVTYDLGPCVPLADGFGICTQVPVKRVGEGELYFFAKSKLERTGNKFAPVNPDKPFPYLYALEKARFAKRNGVPGLIIPDDQPGSDGE